MVGKSELERLERLEGDYAFTREAFEEIRGHLARQNSHIEALLRFKIQVMAILTTLGTITTGSLAIAGIAIAVATGLLQ